MILVQDDTDEYRLIRTLHTEDSEFLNSPPSRFILGLLSSALNPSCITGDIPKAS